VLAGLARDTSTIRLGTMVSSVTFRQPGPLAITVATVDAMSGGRVELGLGSGWFGVEHTSYGIPFPPVRERFDRLEEQLAIVTGLWATPPGETFSFSGAHYSLADSPALPKPVQSPLPVIVGGKGPTRTPALAARFAAEYNVPFDSLEVIDACFDRARRACEAIGRDPSSLVLSAAQTLAVGADEPEVRRRAEAAGGDAGSLRSDGLGGTPAEVVDKLGRLAELGAERVYLQVMDLADLDHLALVAAEVAPHV
jgi:alkanesulfonate monooxygenase SsuD/methylene tetrahydromethanopterin reductase-like flavin-dependent oxidoreductase (luciferase family)